MNKRLMGIFGGTFDPIHKGHLEIAKHVLNKMKLNEVRFIPSYIPPHRHKQTASPKLRFDMLMIALSDHAKFIVDDREIRRKGVSFMIDTLRSIRSEFQDSPFFFIIGFDAFAKLFTWHEWKLLIKYTHFVVVNRSAKLSILCSEMKNFLTKHLTKNKFDLYENLAGNVYFLKISNIPISSTKIRRELSFGKKPLGIDERVYRYIVDNDVYPTHT